MNLIQRWIVLFQSRYRAASHFRNTDNSIPHNLSKVSISLSSGFSFQGKEYTVLHPGLFRFQSRYRAASHFRLSGECQSCRAAQTCFNLVIERLLISG